MARPTWFTAAEYRLGILVTLDCFVTKYTTECVSALPPTNLLLECCSGQSTRSVPRIDPIFIFLNTLLTSRFTRCSFPSMDCLFLFFVFFGQGSCKRAA